MDALLIAQADDDFYRAVDRVAERGSEYRPSSVPDGWRCADEEIWRMWRPGHALAPQGWKVHVSARVDRAQYVLDRTAQVCFAQGVPFKHLACSRFFLLAHHKHGHRAQSGKFCAAYPADEAAARCLLDALTAALSTEDGPAVLSDRRYRDSATVHYRYGAFVARPRVRLDGSYDMLVTDGRGREVPDRRAGRFLLPEGIVDPFMDSTRLADYAALPDGFEPVLNGYRVERVIASSNSGGAYAATHLATGRAVFLKEARAFNGMSSMRTDAQARLRTEYAALRRIHHAYPDRCPQPLELFRLWTNEYLATELVPGTPLREWMVAHNPVIWPAPSAEDFGAYFAQCLSIVDSVGAALDAVHECGYAFVDLSPNNVLVAGDGTARLVDFEAVIPLRGTEAFETLGTPGHAPHRRMYFADRAEYDAYGLAMLALFLIAPLNDTVERNPAVLAHLRDLVAAHTAVPGRLWALATSFHRAAAADFTRTPGPHQVAADPDRHLDALRDKLVTGLLSVVDPTGREVYPLGPQRFLTNDLCVAHGVAGVVHALRFAGVEPGAAVLDRLAAGALSQGQNLPPGLHSGLAGIAWVLADADRPAEAAKLLELADSHPALRRDDPDTATLAYGRAGLGLAHLALYRHTGDLDHVDRAQAHAAAVPAAQAIRGVLGRHGANGLLHGPSGVALFNYYLGLLDGDDGRLDEGLRLVRDDVRRMRAADGGLLLPVSDRDRRLMPYLYAGTAGPLFVASRYLSVRADEYLQATLPAIRAGASCPFTAYPGLYSGLAGLGLVLADHARRHDDGDAARRADLAARRMFLYAVPHREGSHVLGEYTLRLSTDLSFGSAGVLLFLSYLRGARPDPFFTLDRFHETRGR